MFILEIESGAFVAGFDMGRQEIVLTDKAAIALHFLDSVAAYNYACSLANFSKVMPNVVQVKD